MPRPPVPARDRASRRSVRVVGVGGVVLALGAACGADRPAAPDRSFARVGLEARAAVRESPARAREGGFLIEAVARTVRAEVGADAASSMRVIAAQGGAATVRRVGARAVAVRLEGGEVVYEGATAGSDAIVFATRRGVEELAVVHAPSVRLAWDVDAPPAWALVRAPVPGLVELRDERRVARLRLWARRAWDAAGVDVPIEPKVEGRRVRVVLDEARVTRWPVTVDPEWSDATDLSIPRFSHTATTLFDGRVLFADGDSAKLGLAGLYDPRTGTFTAVGPMKRRRAAHTATMLANGDVLFAGGDATANAEGAPDAPTDTTERFDATTGTFVEGAKLLGPRSHHTATRLDDGRVLLAGGYDAGGAQRADAELWDPKTGGPVATTFPLAAARVDHAALALPGGQVLLGGGLEVMPTLERCDPVARACAPLASAAPSHRSPALLLLPSGRVAYGAGVVDVIDPTSGAVVRAIASEAPEHLAATATLLPSGALLLAGGATGAPGLGVTFADARIVDADHGSVRPIAPMSTPRERATATLLASGVVLVAGGYDQGAAAPTSSVEICAPGDAHVEATNAMLAPRKRHALVRLPSGEVLVVGGEGPSGPEGAELYDPAHGTFRAAPPMRDTRSRHTVTALDAGRWLLAGGWVDPAPSWSSASCEIFDAAEGAFVPAPDLATPRSGHAAARLPDGSILFVGGAAFDERRGPDGATTTVAPPGGVERRRATATPLVDGRVLVTGGRLPTPSDAPIASASTSDGTTYAPLPDLAEPRAEHTATRLPDGTVLVAGGARAPGEGNDATASAELFDPAKASFAPLPAMTRPRAKHSATLLADGSAVLLAGGDDSVELFDVASRAFVAVAARLPEPMSDNASAVLADGRVLVAGGEKSDGVSAEAAVFDPATRAFADRAAHARSGHTATPLPDGRLLLVGGFTASEDFATKAAELLDPRTGAWADAGALPKAATGHTATLVDGGRVLVVGGRTGTLDSLKSTTQVARWEAGAFRALGALAVGRAWHAATRLDDGRVLVTGGRTADEPLTSAEIVDPVAGVASATAGPLLAARSRHASAILPSGRVLVAGGVDGSGAPVPTAEIFDPEAGTFRAVARGIAPIAGDTRAIVLPSGAVLLVGDLVSYRYDEAADELTLAGDAPTRTFGGVVLPGGRRLVCGLDACGFGLEGVAPDARVLDGVQREGHTLVASVTGDAVAIGVTPRRALHVVTLGAAPRGAPRPVLTDVPSLVAAGRPTKVGGARFARPSALGADALPPRPDVVPRVVLVPASTGAPLDATVTAFDDTSIAFVAPRPPHPGGGFLHVVVDGVPSEGRWVEVASVAQGGACERDGECVTGHCAEGLCCDSPCDDGCRSCTAARTGAADGTCAPLRAGEVARSGCEPGGGTCGPNGRCDGAGACALPAEGTPCAERRDGQCVAGACVGLCASNLECPSGYVCLPEGRCEPVADPGPDGGACALGTARGAGGAFALLAALASLGALARRRARPTQKA
jgi:hypothetical protein